MEGLIDRQLKKFCSRLNIVRNSDDDFISCVTGETGSGKSTLAIQMGIEIDDDFNLDDNVIFDGNILGKRIYETRKDVLIFDEAIFDIFNRDSMTKMNKRLAKIFTVCRERNHIIFIVIPKFTWLDKIIQERLSFVFWTMKYYEEGKVIRGNYRAYDYTSFNPFFDRDYIEYDWDGKFKKLPSEIDMKYKERKAMHTKNKLFNEDKD